MTEARGITLVLGGGGFKGVAHVGVLCALQEAGIPIERVVGTSVGSMVGAMYCATRDAQDVHDRALDFVATNASRLPTLSSGGDPEAGPSLMGRIVSGIKRQMAFERMYRRRSAFGEVILRLMVRHLVPREAIESLALPLGICALDLYRGEDVLLVEGDLHSAVAASSAVPGFFPPVEREGLLLCDAGLVNNLPTRLARSQGAMRVVAVDLSSSLEPCSDEAAGLEVLFRAQDISTRLSNRRWADHADVVIYPQMASRSWLDAHDPEEMIAEGRAATEANLQAIRALLASEHGTP